MSVVKEMMLTAVGSLSGRHSGDKKASVLTKGAKYKKPQ